MSNIKVGDPLHWYTRNKARQFHGVGKGPYAAIVTQVIADNLVNATIFPPGGCPPFSVGVVIGGPIHQGSSVAVRV